VTSSGWREPWWIPDESPGGLGDEEVWIDAQALDARGGMSYLMVQHVLRGNGGGPWIGQLIRFGNFPGSRDADTVYMVVARRHSRANDGRPYYVARFPGTFREAL
jgi:hypothetical protein